MALKALGLLTSSCGMPHCHVIFQVRHYESCWMLSGSWLTPHQVGCSICMTVPGSATWQRYDRYMTVLFKSHLFVMQWRVMQLTTLKLKDSCVFCLHLLQSSGSPFLSTCNAPLFQLSLPRSPWECAKEYAVFSALLLVSCSIIERPLLWPFLSWLWWMLFFFILMSIIWIYVMSHVCMTSWLANLHGKNFNIRQYMQTFWPKLFILAMLIGTTDLYRYIHYYHFTHLDFGWESQGQCKAKPVGFIFLHFSTDQDEM